MSNNFDRCKESKFEQKMRPKIEDIYRFHLPELLSIERFEKKSDKHILDRNFAIDAILHFSNGSILTTQEKSRQNWVLKHYNQFTFEYYNDPNSNPKLEGEWFHLSSQIYFYGFANINETDYEQYSIIDIARFRIWLLQFDPASKSFPFEIRPNPPPAKANFIGIPFSKFPKECILFNSC